MSDLQTPAMFVNMPPPDVSDWIGVSGLVRVDGVNYHLPTMDVGELNALHNDLALQADDIRAQLAKKDIEGIITGSLLYDALAWRGSARKALAYKKKLMAAIHTEFARRKTLLPPISEFALEAVRHLFGEVGYGRVMSRARELQEKQRIDRSRRSSVPANYGAEIHICTAKLPYRVQDDGVKAIENMEATGMDVSGMTCYGPCPYCGNFHVGHSQIYTRRMRKKVRIAVDKSNGLQM